MSTPTLRNRIGRRLPPGIRSLVALPASIRLGARFLREHGAEQRELLRRLPTSLRPRRWLSPRLLLERIRVELTCRARDFRPRFLEPRWRRSVRLDIPESVRALERSGRGVVLVTVHYGALMFLGRWLCAGGFAHRRLGAFVDDPSWIDPGLRRLPDGRRLAPRVFRPDRLRLAHAFLERGGVLIATMDFPRGKMAPVPAGDRVLRVSTGALRLAAHTGAAVVPCIAWERWWWRGRVLIGEPLPHELVAEPLRHGKACASIVAFMLDTIRRDPLQCSDILLRQFQCSE